MPLRIIMLGDIVGRPGRRAVRQLGPRIKSETKADLLVVNAENADRGTGLTPKQYQRLCDAGVDGLTLGDHAFKKVQIVPLLDEKNNIIRPANLSEKAKGKGWMKLTPENRSVDRSSEKKDKRSLYVMTILGRTYMPVPANDPFACIDHILSQIHEPNPLVLVEVHAEATAEKQAIARYVDGRVSAVVGSHTHVPTADTTIYPEGTAFQCDLGMCGPHESIIGRSIEKVVYHMSTNMPAPFDVPEAEARINGVVIDICEETGKALKIERIVRHADLKAEPF